MIGIVVSPELVEIHTGAVMKRVKKSYDEKQILACVKQLGKDSIEDFVKADVEEMRRWTKEQPADLQFDSFRLMYTRFFSNGAENNVADGYNAYMFLKKLDVTVCPYCDDEYLGVVDIDGKQRRTCEIDHFFPKSRYPALAMCIYNLVPGGQSCNGLKMEWEIGANPHETMIESWTHLFPDLPVGQLLELMEPSECRVGFHATNGMEGNVDKLALEQRYERHAPEVHRLLMNLQRYSKEKIEELVKMGFGTSDEIISSNFGPQNPDEKKKALRQKMLRDLTGY